VLLIDNFVAYEANINMRRKKENEFMQNVKIIFLPVNTTSVCQLLDQDIIVA